MSRPAFFRSLATALGTFILVSCASPELTGPSSANANASLSGSLHHGVAVLDSAQNSNVQLQALWWNRSLSQPVTVSKTIGPSGGTISIAETGLTMVFPSGALTSSLTITVTADTRYVAYKMEPAGTQFLKGVTVTQQLGSTQIQGSSLSAPIRAAYIADDSLSLSGNVPVLEIEPSTTVFSNTAPFLPQAQVWIIRHFSRYMLASG